MTVTINTGFLALFKVINYFVRMILNQSDYCVILNKANV